MVLLGGSSSITEPSYMMGVPYGSFSGVPQCRVVQETRNQKPETDKPKNPKP